MGLHRQRHPFPAPEAERLYKVLYSLDKQRTFTTGQPCNMYSFESDLHTSGKPTSHALDVPDATMDMMSIWEAIYLTLYSSKSKSATQAQRSSQVLSIKDSLEQWNTRFCNTRTSTHSRTNVHLRIELEYYRHTTMVLILRIAQEDDVGSKQLREHCRRALTCIMELGGTDPLSTTVLASLARVFRSSPIVAFMELVSSRLMTFVCQGLFDEEAGRDIELLQGVCNRLEVLQNADLPRSYYNRLQLGMSWAVSVLEGLREASKHPHSITSSDLDVASDGTSQGLDSGEVQATPNLDPASLSSLDVYPLQPVSQVNLPSRNFLASMEHGTEGVGPSSSFVNCNFARSTHEPTSLIRAVCLQSAWDIVKD